MAGPNSRRERALAHRRRASRALLALVVVAAGFGFARPIAAAGNSIRIDPAATRVAQGDTFKAKVVQHADVETSGAGATITFDPAILQIQSVAVAPAYAAAAIKNGKGAADIATANTSGSLTGVAVAFLRPDSVPAGDADVIEVTFKATGCGTSALGLVQGSTGTTLLDGRTDTYGDTLEITTVGATVTTCVADPSGSPFPSPSPSPSASPTTSSTPTPTATPTPTPSGNSLRIEPAKSSVALDGTISARIVQNTIVPTAGTKVSVVFDPTILQVVSITPSSSFADKQFGSSAGVDAIAAANKRGKIDQITGAFATDAENPNFKPSLPAGEVDFVTVEFKAVGCGTTPLLLPSNAQTDAQMLDGRADTYKKTLAIQTVKGAVTACATSATTAPSTPSGNSIRLALYKTGVIENGGFTVRVMRRSTVVTSGIQATVYFDQTMLQVVSVTRSDIYASAPIFKGAEPAAIAAANRSGVLFQVTAAYLPPATLPAGEAEFVSIEFKSIACGESVLLVPSDSAFSSIADGREATYGQPLTMASVKGVVQACDSNASPTPKPTPKPTPTPLATLPPVYNPPPGVPVDPGSLTPPTTGEASLEPSLEPSSSPAPSAQPVLAAAVVNAKPPPGGSPALVRNVAMVGGGIVLVVIGLVMAIGMFGLVLAMFATPFLVRRGRRVARQLPPGRLRW